MSLPTREVTPTSHQCYKNVRLDYTTGHPSSNSVRFRTYPCSECGYVRIVYYTGVSVVIDDEVQHDLEPSDFHVGFAEKSYGAAYPFDESIPTEQKYWFGSENTAPTDIGCVVTGTSWKVSDDGETLEILTDSPLHNGSPVWIRYEYEKTTTKWNRAVMHSHPRLIHTSSDGAVHENES